MEFYPKIVYQDEDYLFCRKPHAIASTWGQELCFLDIIEKWDFDREVRDYQISCFGREWEYGLLNRLDNVTAGLLYFARSKQAKEQYMKQQTPWSIVKIYYAKVYGTPRAQFGWIEEDIYHDKFDETRMTIDPQRGRGQWQEAKTYWEIIEGEPKWESSRLKIVIQSGTRHQIRVHLSSLWHPIVGDSLYMTKWLKKKYGSFEDVKMIELVSAGVYFC